MRDRTIDKLVAALTRQAHPEDLGTETSKLEEALYDAFEKVTHCQDRVEGKATCGVKLDCHLHDWRPSNEN